MLEPKTYPDAKTIQDVIDQRLWLRAHCGHCERATEIPHGLISDMVSPTLSLSEAEPKFKCGGCGEKRAELTVTDPLDNWC